MKNPIARIIGWKFDYFPGMMTRENVITQWPEALGPVPTAAQLEVWDAEYEASGDGRPEATLGDIWEAIKNTPPGRSPTDEDLPAHVNPPGES